MRTLKSEFPDYDGELTNLPPFTFEPWHNDVCPLYYWRGWIEGGETPELANCELILGIDYVDPNKREFPERRFLLSVGQPYLGSLTAETEGEFVQVLHDWYEQAVGYVPETTEIGRLCYLVGTIMYLQENQK